MKQKFTHDQFAAAYRDFRAAKAQSPDEIHTFEFQQAEFDGLLLDSSFDLSEAVFLECDFRRCRLSQADLYGANLGYSRFSDCAFTAVNLNKAQIDEAVFDDCAFSASTFIRSDLSDTRFIRCFFSACDFTSAFVSDTAFRGGQVGADCSFSEVDPRGVSFVDLTGFTPRFGPRA